MCSSNRCLILLIINGHLLKPLGLHTCIYTLFSWLMCNLLANVTEMACLFFGHISIKQELLLFI